MQPDPAAIRVLSAWAGVLSLPPVLPVAVFMGESNGDLNAIGDQGRAFGGLQTRADVWGYPGGQWLGLQGLARSITALTPQWQRATRPLLYEWQRYTWPQKVEAFARFWASAQRADADAVSQNAEAALRAGYAALEGMNVVTIEKPAIEWKAAAERNYEGGRKDNAGGTIAPECWVLHIAQGSFDGIASWFATPPEKRNPPLPSSAHFSVAKDGRIRQHVSMENTAFANGIIQDGFTAKLIRENRYADGSFINPNLWTVSCEHEGMSGEAPTPAMFEASTRLCAWVFQTELLVAGASDVAIDRDHIIRHADISPQDRAGCPGWSESVIADYIARVRQLVSGPVVPPPVEDYRAEWIEELNGIIAAANDDATRAAVRIQDARRKLTELGV